VPDAASDGSLRIRGRDVLDLRLDGGQTVRRYLASVITGVLYQPGGEGLRAPVEKALIDHGMLKGPGDEAAMQVICDAIDVLAAEPFKPIGMKTATERRLAQLQRRHSGKR
jgi:hypothetical protein